MSDEIEYENRPRSNLLLAGGGHVFSFQHPEELMAAVADSGPDDWIEVSSFTHIGDPAHLKLDPHSIWIERRVVVGVAQVTRAYWNDRLADLRQAALAPVHSLSVPGQLGRTDY